MPDNEDTMNASTFLIVVGAICIGIFFLVLTIAACVRLIRWGF